MFSHAKHFLTHTHIGKTKSLHRHAGNNTPPPRPKIIHIWNTSESKKLRTVKTTDTDCVHSDEKKYRKEIGGPKRERIS